MRPNYILVFQDKNANTTQRTLEDVDSFWLSEKDGGWDITISEDTEGNPYVSIAIHRDIGMEIQDTDPSWKGKIIKLIRKK